MKKTIPMKATLEFNLPEEDYEFKLAANAANLMIVIDNMKQFFRSKLKYEDLPQHDYDLIESIQTKLFEECEEYGIYD